MGGRAAEAVSEFRIALAANPNASIVRAWYGFALFVVADYETIIEVGSPMHRMSAYNATGDLDAAHRTLENFDIRGSAQILALGDIGHFLNVNNDSQAYVDYVLNEYGTLETLLRTQPIELNWGIGYVGELAYAYLQIGEDEVFAELMELARTKLDSGGEEGTNNFVVPRAVAQNAALTGDIEEAISSLQQAIDAGFRDNGHLESRTYDNLRGQAEFEAIRQTLAKLVDEERAKLGMDPYLPFSALDEQRKDAVWQP